MSVRGRQKKGRRVRGRTMMNQSGTVEPLKAGQNVSEINADNEPVLAHRLTSPSSMACVRFALLSRKLLMSMDEKLRPVLCALEWFVVLC